MSKLDSAEKTTISISDVFYYVILILSIITIILGLVISVNETISLGLIIVVAAVINIFVALLSRALIQTIVNISLKLDVGADILKKISIIESLLPTEQNAPKPANPNKPISNVVCEKTSKVEEPKVYGVEKVADLIDEQPNELDKEVIELISKGKELDARSLLIRFKDMSFSGAISYIENIKSKM